MLLQIATPWQAAMSVVHCFPRTTDLLASIIFVLLVSLSSSNLSECPVLLQIATPRQAAVSLVQSFPPHHRLACLSS